MTGTAEFINKHSKFSRRNNPDGDVNIVLPGVGSYDFTRPDLLSEFMTLYEKERREKKELYFAELQDPDNSGIMLDFDICVLSSKSTRSGIKPATEAERKKKTYIEHYVYESEFNKTRREIFTFEFYEKLTNLVLHVISEFDDTNQESFSLDPTQKHLLAITAKPKILEIRQSYNFRQTIWTKFGFHLLLPTIGANRTLKKAIIKRFNDYLLSSEIESVTNLFKPIIETFAKAEQFDVKSLSAEFLDENSAHVPVFFVGSKSKPDKPAYKLDLAAEFQIEHKDIDKERTRYRIKKGSVTDLLQDWKKDSKINVALELSLNNNSELKQYKRVELKPKGIAYDKMLEYYGLLGSKKAKDDTSADPDDEDSDEPLDLDILKRLLMGLSPKRASEYGAWTKICWAVEDNKKKKSGDKQYGPKCYEILNQFSRQADNYKNEDDVIAMAEKSTGKVTIGTVWHFLKEDNYQLFKTLCKERKITKLSKSAPESEDGKKVDEKYIHEIKLLESDFTDSDVQKYFKRKGWRKHFILCGKKLYFYNQKKKRWIVNTEEYEDLYKQMDVIYENCREALDNTYKSRDAAKIHAEYSKKLTKLLNTRTIDGIIKLIKKKIVVHEENFDMNPHLVGFENGLYDLDAGIFREAKPEDMVSMSTGYNYEPADSDEMKTKIEFVRNWFRQIVADPEEAEFVLRVLASCIYGENLPYFFIFYGRGSNGKSALMDFFMKHALGDHNSGYYFKGMTSILQQPTKDSRKPEVAMINKKRLVVYSEAESSLPLNSTVIKDYTGSGNIKARLNYSNNTDVKNFATHIMLCNEVPKIGILKSDGNQDDAVLRRLFVIKFKSWFVNEETLKSYPDSQESKLVFPINTDYTGKSFAEKYRMPFLHLLFEAFQTLKADKYQILRVPASIRQETDLYFKSSDTFLGWFKNEYKYVGIQHNKGNCISLMSAWSNFKNSLPKSEQKNWNKDKFQQRITSYSEISVNFRSRYTYTDSTGTKVDIRNAFVGYRSCDADADADAE